MTGVYFPGVAKARRRRLIRRLTLAGVLLVVLLGSALLWPRTPAIVYTVPTSTTAVRATGVFQGPLQGSRTGHRVCLWVDRPDGRAFLVLPAGWSSDTHLDLIDQTGGVLIPAGQQGLFLGRPGSTRPPAGCSGTGRTWAIQSVRLPARSASG